MTAGLAAQHKPATYADVEAVPPHMVAEILFGRLVTHPRPVPRHVSASGVANIVIGGPYQIGVNGPGGWILLPEPELHLGPHVVVPDLAGWRRERLTEAAVAKAYIEVAPDWVLETLSPSTEKFDRGAKRRIYAEFGVRHLWHLDPRVHCLETFTLEAGHWLLDGTWFDADDVCATPFTQITFSLGLFWPFDPMPEPGQKQS